MLLTLTFYWVALVACALINPSMLMLICFAGLLTLELLRASTMALTVHCLETSRQARLRYPASILLVNGFSLASVLIKTTELASSLDGQPFLLILGLAACHLMFSNAMDILDAVNFTVQEFKRAW